MWRSGKGGEKVSKGLGPSADKHISLEVFANSSLGTVTFALPIHVGGKEIESWFAPVLGRKKD